METIKTLSDKLVQLNSLEPTSTEVAKVVEEINEMLVNTSLGLMVLEVPVDDMDTQTPSTMTEWCIVCAGWGRSIL